MNTVFDVLTAANPTLTLGEQAAGGNTKSSYVVVKISDVSIWEDFNLEAIMAAYGDLLQMPSLTATESPTQTTFRPPRAQCEVRTASIRSSRLGAQE